MKKILTFLLLLSISNIISAQSSTCLQNGITFTSQYQIDQFESHYPGCTEILGYVRIEEYQPYNIQSLNGLEQIEQIDGNLTIINNSGIKNLIGFDNLDNVGGALTIENNSALKNLNGLNSLTEVNGNFYVKNNAALQSLTGVNNLTSIGGNAKINSNTSLIDMTGLNSLESVNGDFQIASNNALLDFTGLTNLTSIGGFFAVGYNSSLISFSGLNNLESIGGFFSVVNDDKITNFYGLSNLTEISGAFNVVNNDQLKSLDGMDNLNTIQGYLKIYNNLSIQSLSGLEGVSSIGEYLAIYSNPSLIRLNGLNNITSIGGYLDIYNSTLLTDISALSNLTQIGGYLIFESISISDFNALENLSSINGYILIRNLPNITSLDGLGNIDPATINSSSPVFKDINIYNNPSLSECEVLSICEVLNNGGTTDIHDNMAGCNSEAEVQSACTPPDCTNLTNPVNGETGVDVSTNISWEASDGADGYYLIVGTYPGTGDIQDGDVGNVTVWNPPSDFDCGTTIYVTVNPYNNAPYDNDCDEESFETEYVIADAGEDVDICLGDATQLHATGGTSYLWQPKDFLSDPYIANPVASPTHTITYTVTVENDDGCSDTDEVTVTVHELPDANASATDETGNGFNDGTATSDPIGGSPAYTYSWSNGKSTQTISNLSPGNYTVTVIDFYECQDTQTVTVNAFECPIMTINDNVQHINCHGECSGSIQILSVDSATAPLQYLWNTGDTTSSIDNLCPGKYSVTITDALNCSVYADYTIYQNSELLVSITKTDETANNANDGTASASPKGGVPPYDYNWSNGQTTQTITGLAPGTYTVTVTDSLNCTATQTTTIEPYDCPDIIIHHFKTDASCYNSCSGSIRINSVENATNPLSYTWSNGQTGSSIANLCAGIYYVTVTDSLNCYGIDTISITQPDSLAIISVSKTDITDSLPHGQIRVTVIGGTMPYSFNWTGSNSYSSHDQNIFNLDTGCYVLTVVDSNGCSVVSDEICIEDMTTATIDVHNKKDIKIYPNPANNYLYIKYDDFNTDDAVISIDLINISGDKIVQNIQKNNKVDISNISDGVYFIRFKTRKGLILKKLIIVK